MITSGRRDTYTAFQATLSRARGKSEQRTSWPFVSISMSVRARTMYWNCFSSSASLGTAAAAELDAIAGTTFKRNCFAGNIEIKHHRELVHATDQAVRAMKLRGGQQ